MTTVRPHRGFTLVEVAFSLAIISGVVITVMLMLASIQKTMQRSRMGIYAAAIATNLMEAFQQPQEDLRTMQDGNNPFSTGMVKNKDGAYSIDDSRRPDFQMSGFGATFGTAGQNDWETRALAMKTIIPIPSEIARRLDSPGDEIGKMLDAGGKLYYLAPGEGDAALTVAGAGNRGQAAELTKLVFGVVGSAQQNTLHTHPIIMPTRAMYPFPPDGIQVWDDYNNQGGGLVPRRWRAKYDYGVGNYLTMKRVAPGPLSVIGGDLTAVDCEITEGGYARLKPEAQSWEMHSYIDEKNGVVSSRWTRGLPCFWRLTNYHWNRIYYQLSAMRYQASAATPYVIKRPKMKTVTRTVTEQQVSYDIYLNPTYTTVTKTITEQVPDPNDLEDVTITPSPEMYLRGVPTPPIGLPMVQGCRGTDILYEDAETLADDRWNQMRIGLPCLERRVMYRTAALALWAKVDDNTDLMQANPSVLGTASDVKTSNPNIVDNAGGWTRNPLLQMVPLPANPSDIHATQVLALSHLAHAAIMVTGYKPPFVDENNSLDATTHLNLVTDEDAPYKDPDTSTWYYLRHPFYVTTTPTTASGPTDSEVQTAAALTVGTGAEAALDTSGNPIAYRRMPANALVKNPFPGPYADRGAFNWKGEPAWTRDASSLRITSHGAHAAGTGFTASDPSDTQMARTAMENALRWAMAYAHANPYDQIVPKPLNCPTAIERPLWAFSLFDGSGNALRGKPSNWTNDDQCNRTVIWGSDRARWPLNSGNIMRMFSFTMMRSGNWNDTQSFNVVTNPKLNPVTQQTDAGGSPIGTGQYLNPLALGGISRMLQGGGTYDRHSNTYANGISAWRELHYWSGARGPTNLAAVNNFTKSGTSWADRVEVSPRRSQWWYDSRKPDGTSDWQVADRTRQLVFWAVNWQSFEDAESQPSEPVDYSNWNLSMYQIGESPGSSTSTSALMRRGHPESHLMWGNPARDATLRNPPSKDVTFRDYWGPWRDRKQWDSRSNVDGTGISFTNVRYDPGDPMPWGLVGAWGADRNANGVWDRGRIPANTRMTAEEVCRFPFYDPVIWTTLGN